MTPENFAFDRFLAYRNVPRGTFDRLSEYVRLLKKWQSSINLISKTTLDEIWERHIIDSSQLMDRIKDGDAVVDVGSGGGFPGLVLAILGIGNMTLVESDGRKIEFLKEAARITDTKVTLVRKRIEEVDIGGFSVITARAFAPLPALFQIIHGRLNSLCNILLLKGKQYFSEINLAQEHWSFDHQVFPSITQQGGVILSIKNLKMKEAP